MTPCFGFGTYLGLACGTPLVDADTGGPSDTAWDGPYPDEELT